MDVINLDDTGDSSLFVLDETPNLGEAGVKTGEGGAMKQGRKRKVKRPVKKANSYVVLGGSIADDSPASAAGSVLRVARAKRRKTSVETIVIEDDEESVIELSDDEKVGVIGGLLSGSFQRIQSRISEFQRMRQRKERAKKVLKQNNQPKETPNVVPYHCPKKPGCSPKKSEAPRRLRPIVIDGSNVAFGHGNRAVFSTRGIEICCDYFRRRGHTVKVFIPQFRRRHPATSDTHILDKLEAERVIVFTPSRRVNGKVVVSYDDRMMVEYAATTGAVIVTRDNLQDLVSESESFKDVINNRVLMFTWVDEEIIMFPQDPLGRKGPTLNEFLSFPPDQDEEGTNNENSSQNN